MDATETRKRSSGHQAILAGMVAGALLGGALNLGGGRWASLGTEIARHLAEPVGQLFLRLLLVLVVPLVFSSLIVGIVSIGDLRRLGRVGGKCLLYTLVISAISVVIGLTVANTLEPGRRIDEVVAVNLRATWATDAESRVEIATTPGGDETPLMKVVTTLVPRNIVAAVASDPPDMLGLMFFAIFFGAALAAVPATRREPVVAFFEGLYEAVLLCIGAVMRLAPIAVFCLLFAMTTRFGFGLLGSLGWYVGAVLLGLGIQMFVVYPISLRLLSKISPVEFFRRTREVIVTAFSTSSSNATLPTALRVSEERLGVPREVNGFVLTVGATANQNGTALFEGVTVLFLAQLAGVDLSAAQQLMVLYLAILGGIGTAGVPSGSIPFVIIVLATIGVDPALIAIVLGVDRLLDMSRTVLNVTGDLTIATWIARTEGHALMPAENLEGTPAIGSQPAHENI